MSGLPKVTVTVKGGITRPSLNKDGVSGMVFYNNNIADLTTFSASNRIVKFVDLLSVEATGITSTSTNFAEEWYQAKEFFRLGGTELYIGVFAVPVSTYDFAEVTLMKNFSNGEIKIYGVYNPEQALNVAEIAKLQALMVTLESEKKPAYCVYCAETGTIQLSGLADLRNLASDCPNVSVVAGRDISLIDKYINLGAFVGALSGAGVEENVLNTGVYNYTDGINMVNVGLVLNNGTSSNVSYDIKDITAANQDTINDKGYVFWRYLPNLAGTYLSNDNNSAKITNTFNSAHIVRVKNKVIRDLDTVLSGFLGSKVIFTSTGTIDSISIIVFEKACKQVLDRLISDNEISAYDIYIDPSQNTLSTKTVTVQVSIVPVESADYINIDVSFVASL
jgi:hypothetical protein